MIVKSYPSALSARERGGDSKKDRSGLPGEDLWADLKARALEVKAKGGADKHDVSKAAASRHGVQVEADHYGESYLNLPRMVTYWYQVEAVRECAGRTVLEVGVGMGLTAWILRSWGYALETLDLDPALSPTCVGDVTSMPFADDSFDTILIAEVLEHLPFEEFGAALAELRRVTRRHVIVTLPCPLVGVHLGLNICGIDPKFVAIGGRQWTRPVFDGQHYWELDRRGYSKRRIRRKIRDAGFDIVQEFRPGLSLYNYFFVLQKRRASVC